MASTATTSGIARFRVSDVVPVPLRGRMLRLRLVEGDPAGAALKPGRHIRLRGPDGAERVVRILDLGTPSGRARPDRLARTREIDVVITEADATAGGEPVRIGWTAELAG